MGADSTQGRAPLAGLVVVAFEQAVSVPFCTRMLGDLGARVIKVEVPAGGDFTRHYDQAVRGLSAHFAWLNRNKESLTLDCKLPEARPVLDRLIACADIVLQNLAPGAAERLGIDAAGVVKANPRAVAVDVSGYGRGGPLAARRAYDLLVQAETGSCAITGEPGRPAKPGIPIADVGAGLYAVIGILTALVDRGRTGRGAAVEVSMFDAVADLLGFALNYTRYTGSERPPNGMSSPMVSPYGAYPTRDGATVVLGTTNDAEWQRLARQLLGRADLADEPALATNEQRVEARPRIDAVIAGWTVELELADILARADAAKIGCATLNSITEVLAHPQLAARGRWVDVDSPVGALSTLLPVPTSAAWELPLAAVPGLGEHTAAILGELDLEPALIEALREAGGV